MKLMNKKLPIISVVITNYNYGEFLDKSIRSVITQTYRNIEIILIDDCSIDNSKDIYKKFSKKIKIIEHEKNKGIVETRNEAIDVNKGDFLCFLDADDYFDDDYIENLYRVLIKNEADIVYPNWRLFGNTNEKFIFDEFDEKKLQLQEIHITPASLVRKSGIKNLRFESKEVAEDWDFFVRLSLLGVKFKVADNVFINYQIKDDSRGSRHKEIEDIKLFLDILNKIRKENKEIVSNEEFLLSKLKIKFDVIDKLISALNDEKKSNIDKDIIIRDRNKAIRDLNKAIEEITQSKTYKTALKASNIIKKIKR